jgi:hypothetical protein
MTNFERTGGQTAHSSSYAHQSKAYKPWGGRWVRNACWELVNWSFATWFWNHHIPSDHEHRLTSHHLLGTSSFRTFLPNRKLDDELFIHTVWGVGFNLRLWTYLQKSDLMRYVSCSLSETELSWQFFFASLKYVYGFPHITKKSKLFKTNTNKIFFLS